MSIAPNMPKPTRTPITVAIEKVDERKSFSGMSASSFITDSTITNAITPMPPMT